MSKHTLSGDQLASFTIPSLQSATTIDSLATKNTALNTPSAIAQIVYHAIDRQCGSCHQGTHSTNTKALAIFNLADECWYCKLTREQAAGVIRRTKGSAFSAEEQDAIKSLMEKIAANTL